MATVRERLDNLTSWIHGELDRVLGTVDDARSIAAADADVDAINVQLEDLNTEIAAIDADIAALVAVETRNAVQNSELRSLRLHKKAAQRDRQGLLVDRSNTNRIKMLKQRWIRVARLALMLDGGPTRVRQSDLDGSDG